jgi:hypothetical protein
VFGLLTLNALSELPAKPVYIFRNFQDHDCKCRKFLWVILLILEIFKNLHKSSAIFMSFHLVSTDCFALLEMFPFILKKLKFSLIYLQVLELSLLLVHELRYTVKKSIFRNLHARFLNTDIFHMFTEIFKVFLKRSKFVTKNLTFLQTFKKLS